MFVICTNRQAFGAMKRAPKTLEALKSVDGFGKKKIDRSGQELVSLVGGFYGDTDER